MKKLMALALALFLLLSCACAESAFQVSEGAAYDPDAHQMIISLIENASTGYQWTYADASDKSILSPAADESLSMSEGDLPALGAPSLRMWRFDVKGAGETTLTFSYARSFEENSTCHTVTIKISVSEAGEISYSVAGLTL